MGKDDLPDMPHIKIMGANEFVLYYIWIQISIFIYVKQGYFLQQSLISACYITFIVMKIATETQIIIYFKLCECGITSKIFPDILMIVSW